MLDNILYIFQTILYVILFFLSVALIKNFITEPIFKKILPNKDFKSLQALVTIVFQLLIYYLIMKLAYGTAIFDKYSVLEFFIGILIAIVIMGISILVIKRQNVFTIEKVDSFKLKYLYTQIAVYLVLALMEEILFRGIIYDSFRMKYSFIVVVVVTTLLFFIPHLLNKGITFLSIVSLLLLGIFIGTLREIGGDIFLPFGFHFMWNLMQGYFGFQVSGGKEINSYYKATPIKSNKYTGGIFGIEASIITITFLLVGTVFGLLYFIYL